jgi:hypothetical protein
MRQHEIMTLDYGTIRIEEGLDFILCSNVGMSSRGIDCDVEWYIIDSRTE